MNKYTKGAVFTLEVNGAENCFSVVDSTTINDANYILAVPIEKKEEKVVSFLDEVLAFRTYEDDTVMVETDEAIISQIVNNLLP